MMLFTIILYIQSYNPEAQGGLFLPTVPDIQDSTTAKNVKDSILLCSHWVLSPYHDMLWNYSLGTANASIYNTIMLNVCVITLS